MPIKFTIFTLGCVMSFLISSAQDTVINSYATVFSFNNACSNTLTVDAVTGFNIGDDVLLIQMKGVDIDTSNTSTFGQIVNWNGCGNYELNKIQSITGNSITLLYATTKTYNIPSGKVQLIKVPHFSSYFINKVHTSMPWNGSKGGVFAIIADDSLVLNNDINVKGKGFVGGVSINPVYTTQFACNQQDYCSPVSQFVAGQKGEGIGIVINDKIFSRGPLYNGGGGGNSTNCGGGGNGGEGGRGGDQFDGCSSPNLGGIGGKTFNYTPTINKLFLGGGGGAGDENNGFHVPGGNGGGIVVIITNKIKGNNYSILADGNQGQDCYASNGICDDGMGGGGAGGTVLLNAQTISQLSVSVKGGRGLIQAMQVLTDTDPAAVHY